MRKIPLVILLTIMLLLSAAGIADAADDLDRQPLAWLDGLTLVILESDDVASLHRARAVIQEFGGRIAIMSPPSMMLGWIPFELRDDLIGRAGIKDIYYTEVLPEEAGIADPHERRMLNYFNSAVRGDLREGYRMRRALAPAHEDVPKILPDVLDPPAFEEDAYLENLRAAGLNTALLKDRGLLLEKSGEAAAGNSDKMTGTVALTVFFVESDGSGSDPNQYTWTEQDMQDYINGVNNGLAWWTEQSYNHTDCWVAFMVRYMPGTDPRCSQWYEPLLHPSTDQINWVGLVMNNFGYTAGTTTTKVSSFNTWQRSAYGTDRAYSAFVAYNPPPSSDRFTNGYAAAAYWGGPYTYLLFRSFDWEVEEVFCHETGHVFYACDEYYQAGYGGCGGCGVCYNGVINGNCEKDGCGPGKNCMMNNNTFSLCQYTPGHVGWFTSPCAPPPLAAPTVASAFPDGQYQGFDDIVTVTGSNFHWGTFIDLGPDIVVNSMAFVSPETIRADISILNQAAAGLRNLVVYNRDLQSVTLPGAFRVKNTTRHYMSPSGGNVYPYINPADAATSLTDAIAVANNGDSLFVASTTFSGISVLIDHGVKLYGGWVDGFGVRDLAAGKTQIDLKGNVTISSGGTGAVLDGFIIENGEGVYQTVPFQADYGGGIRILNATAAITNCEIRSNVAGVGEFDTGIGGGIFAMNSVVTIENNHIWGNDAQQGGGIYLYNTSGSVTGNTISSNHVGAPNPSDAKGAGLYLRECTGIVLANNTIDGNGGAHSGGGCYFDMCGAISLSGGAIAGNDASWEGAGVCLKQSAVTIDAVEFLRNHSALFAGGVSLGTGSSLTINDCRLLWNTGAIGGGVYANGGECFANHNLFVGGSAGSGGALYLSNLTGGSVLGNTVDRSVVTGTGGAVQLIASNAAVFNNIISNSSRYGLFYMSAPVVAPKYNNVWNSASGDFYGCAPGEGSMSTDPLYADTAGVDYHLAVHSPAIDAGDTSGVYSDPDGSRGDMGFYGSHSFAMYQPSYPKHLEQSVASGNAVLQWNRNPETDIEYYAVYRDITQGFTPSLANFVQFVPAADTVFTEPYVEGMFYRISAVDSSLYGSGYSAGVSPIPSAAGDDPVPFTFDLAQNVPNPFNPITTIRYEIERTGPVALVIYDVEGRVVKRLVDEIQTAGSYRRIWNGRNQDGSAVSSGVYFYKLIANGQVRTRKMVVLK